MTEMKLYKPGIKSEAEAAKTFADSIVETLQGIKDAKLLSKSDVAAVARKLEPVIGPLVKHVNTLAKLKYVLKSMSKVYGDDFPNEATDALRLANAEAMDVHGEHVFDGVTEMWDDHDAVFMALCFNRRDYPDDALVRFEGDFPEQYRDKYGVGMVLVPAELVAKHGQWEAFVLHTRLPLELVQCVSDRLWCKEGTTYLGDNN